MTRATAGAGEAMTKGGRRRAAIAMKCREEYKAWVEDLARKQRTTPSQLLDWALADFAEAAGFGTPPDR